MAGRTARQWSQTTLGSTLSSTSGANGPWPAGFSLLLCEMGMLPLSWSCLAYGMFLTNVSSTFLPLHPPPPNSIHTQEKSVKLQHRKYFPITFLFLFSHRSQISNTCSLSLSTAHSHPISQCSYVKERSQREQESQGEPDFLL